MKFSDKILSQTVTQLCLAKGIDHIVISPGSRNAPLIIGFTHQPDFQNFSIVDERSAAFFALGMAQQTGKPVALVCTSGSAVLNYYPAVAEAFYSDIPLVVLSADRPESLLEIGDGQTIRQENVFSNHILYSANCKDGDEFQQYNETQINIALNTAIELQGPVHINLPFAEPLYHVVDDLSIRPQHVPARHPQFAINDEFNDLKKRWNSSAKKLVLVGVMPPDSVERSLIDQLTKDDSVVILTETTSNWHHPYIIDHIDQLIAGFEEEDKKAFQPDMLITFGGMVVSKKIKALLRSYPPKDHWHIDAKKGYDTYFSLTSHIAVSARFFLKNLLAEVKPVASDYRDHWLSVRDLKKDKHRQFVNQAPYSDLKAFAAIFGQLSGSIHLQLSNSTTIRYAQLFEMHQNIPVFCNRGTSGIDGSTSTAIGAAVVSDRPVILVTGDLSFFYDNNALWNEYRPSSFKIILVNNSGGGIFRILPGAKQIERFESFFETRHDLNARHLCEMHGLSYRLLQDENDLKTYLKEFIDQAEGGLLEIVTPPDVNDWVLKEYFEALR